MNNASSEVVCLGIEAVSEQITDAIKDYLDSTARKHDCPGFNCCLCAVGGYRYAAISGIIYFLLQEKGIRLRNRSPHGQASSKRNRPLKTGNSGARAE